MIYITHTKTLPCSTTWRATIYYHFTYSQVQTCDTVATNLSRLDWRPRFVISCTLSMTNGQLQIQTKKLVGNGTQRWRWGPWRKRLLDLFPLAWIAWRPLPWRYLSRMLSRETAASVLSVAKSVKDMHPLRHWFDLGDHGWRWAWNPWGDCPYR